MLLYAEPHWLSPFVFPVFVTLLEKGISFETVEVDVDAGEHRRPELASKMVTAKVPTLEHEGFVLGESTAIVEWLEERFASPDYPSVLPGSPEHRARARQIIAWIRSDLGALKRDRPTSTMFYRRADQPLQQDAQADAQKLFSLAERLLADGAQTILPAWSIADAELAWTLQRLIINGDDVPARLHEYAEAQWQRPSIRAYVEHPRRPDLH